MRVTTRMDELLNTYEISKSISSSSVYFIFTCKEFSTCGEQFFQLHSNSPLYFIFIFIKIIFLLFYLNFFSLSSFLTSLLNPSRSAQSTTPGCHRSVTHATNTSRSTTPQPYPRLNHTHGSTTTPGLRSTSKPKLTSSKPTPRKSKTPDEKKKNQKRE